MITAKVKRVEFLDNGVESVAVINRLDNGLVRVEVSAYAAFNVEDWRQLAKHIEIKMIEMGVEE